MTENTKMMYRIILHKIQSANWLSHGKIMIIGSGGVYLSNIDASGCIDTVELKAKALDMAIKILKMGNLR